MGERSARHFCGAGPPPRVKPGVAARVAAADLVMRVMDGGAYSNVLARKLADHHPPAVASHAQRLGLDALRYLHSVDVSITAAASRPVDALDPPVRAVLRVGGAELAGGGAVHAAVDSAVESIRALGTGRAAGFVNGVMRRLAEQPPSPAPAATTPEWMVERLASAWGSDKAMEFFAASAEIPKPGVRVRRSGVDHEPSGIPDAGYVASRELSDLVASGNAVVGDPSSTAVGVAVGARPGESVLDMAAAPGGKTAHLWDQMDGRGLLVAADRHLRRLNAARRRLRHIGLDPSYVVADGRRPPFRNGSFDRVLLDAPCTGLGTIRRRPEILHRIQPEDPARLGALQSQLLESALRLVRPGGSVIYSVCTVFPEETIDVVADTDARSPHGIPGEPWGSGLLLAPHLTGTDGMFIAEVTRAVGPPG